MLEEGGEQSSEGDETQITRRETNRIGGLRTGTRNTLTVSGMRADMLELEDVNFHFDSAVLLPDFGEPEPQPSGTPEQNRITGLAVLYACYRHAREHPDQKLLIAGHTDRSGPPDYNVRLSILRAQNALHALMGEREQWVEICEQKHKVEDYQQILKWIAGNWGWDCDPGPVNNQQNQQTRDATESFQRRYNQQFNSSIGEDGVVGEETWGAFFDVYMRELVLIMGTDEAGLERARQAIHFLDDAHKSVGCGENFPITPDRAENYRSSVDRRVEFLFFDPGEEPQIECLSPTGRCNPLTCELYNSDMYQFTPIPVNPLPRPSGTEIVVSLKLIFKDPENTDRNFPQNFPVVVEFPDGSTQNEQVGENGMLIFRVLREKSSFTLRFRFSAVNYIASSPRSAATGQPEELITSSQVEDYHNRNHRLFSVPLDWNLSNSDWEVRDAPSYYQEPNFTGLQSIDGNIGSDASPVEMALNPHWQYLKFLYYDRFLKQKLSILPVILEGFVSASSASGDPDTRSNWVTDPQACQALPWILQDPPKPDRDILIQFRTPENTFIESQSGGSRSIVSGTQRNTPNTDRLKFYDLPQLWKSSNYFARLSGGSGAPPARVGVFADLAGETTTDERPLMFYLDDMVLVDTSLNPISWTPDTTEQNRVAIFCNTFDNTGPSSSNLSPMGLYKPDTGNRQSWFTQRPRDETTRNYIADYPDWTRLVITQGNIFDVFDRRTRDGSGNVVGARAAVRILDVFASSSTFIQPGTERPSPPSPTRSTFCTIQPLFEQRHDAWWTSSHSDDRGTGRFDMILLRCCDVVDTDFELAVALHYVRYCFNYNPTPESDDRDSNGHAAAPSNLTGNTARDYTDATNTVICNRWNGDDSFNSLPTYVLPRDTTTNKLKVCMMVYVQALPRNMAHLEVCVFRDIRAYVGSDRGREALKSDPTASNVSSADGWLTAAHEAGHCMSLGDDYTEMTSPSDLPGYSLPGFDSFSPGAPFNLETVGMMMTNRRLRSRYAWHVAEWLHILENKRVDFVVRCGTQTYEIPHHPSVGNSFPERSHVNWPVAQQYDVTQGTHGKFDVFLYPLGNDEYSRDILPSLSSSSDQFDGIICVIVKMKFDFDITSASDIHTWLNQADTRISRRFNGKYYATGSVSGRNYTRCLLHFSPRYWVDDYSTKDPRITSEHIEVRVRESGSSEWDSGIFTNNYLLFFRRSHSASTFATFFGNMIGLSDGTTTTPADFRSIARVVMPNANVQSI